MDKIIGIGNALVDVLVRLEDDLLLSEVQLPKGGMQLIDENRQDLLSEWVKGLPSYQATGGSAGNTILALANLGAKPGFIGKIGNDEKGRFFADNCMLTGIDARLIHSERHTGVANTFVTPDGERTFGTCLGAAATMKAAEITPELFHGYSLLHIEGYLVQNHKLIESICRIAKAEGLRLSIDLASYNVVAEDLDFFRYLVREFINIVFANEEESSAFTNGKNTDEALYEIAEMCDVAVIKLGSKGSCAMRGDEKAFISANKVNVVDTTAAGDFFAGGFLYSFVKGRTLEECLRTGALLSEHVIQVMGTKLTDEVWRKIRSLC